MESKTYSRQTNYLIMAKPTTEQLQTEIQELVNKYNESIEAQAKWKQRIIEIQAILTDRADDGTTENSSTES